ncbi:sulfurtransferase [Luteimonas abyssi]|uniref:sulfurtransferase n=1 Tax=Luteimonas abyssi TaxID=1247514 RepID=UPI000737C213|nr:sulfurtransferase [Luteimonas abyssi]
MSAHSASSWRTLVACEEVHAALDASRQRATAEGSAARAGATTGRAPAELVVVDCRFSLSAPAAGAGAVEATGEAAWRTARIPGARYAHLDRDLSGPHRPGAGRHPWPDPVAFATTIAGWGIGPDTRVALYDDGDGAMAARLWCLLRASGHREVAVVDGGWARWRELGLPQETGAPAAVAVPAIRPATSHWRAPPLDADDVRAHLKAGLPLIDARAAARFRGETEPLDRVAGHVPGALNRPYAENLEEGRFKSATVLRAEFLALLGEHEPGQAVLMCGSGVTACHHLLAMAHAGLDGARLYAGSWSGWIENPTRPVATGSA